MTSFVKWNDYCTFFKAAECSLPSLPWNFFLHFTNPIDTISLKKNFISSINAILKFHFLHFRAVWTSLLLWKVLWKNGTMERLIVPVKASTHKEVKWGLEPSAWTMSSGCFLILFIQGGLDEMTRQSLDSDCS